MKTLFSKRMLMLLLMGFSSGFPLSLTGSTLQAWLKHENVDLTWIGTFSLLGLPYTIKFLWAPFFDRFTLPFLDRRRSWALLCQIALAVCIALMGFVHPGRGLGLVAALAFGLSFFSATQDIVLDAYRRELLADNELGLGSSIFICGYRVGIVISTAGALILADHLAWNQVYLLLSMTMLVGVFTSLFAPTPNEKVLAPVTLAEAVKGPLVNFFERKDAFLILGFMFLYKIGDSMAATMTTPFVLSMGFSQTQLGLLGNTWGMGAAISGGILGGLLILKLGIYRSLWIFGFLQMISTIGFCLLDQLGRNEMALALTIGVESLASGMGTSAFVAFIASLCHKRFTATQYALLSSLTGLPRVFAGAPTGFLAKNFGWSPFFILCTLAAIPGLFLLVHLRPKVSEPVVMR